jgi:hypothetical protein
VRIAGAPTAKDLTFAYESRNVAVKSGDNTMDFDFKGP